MSVLYHKNTDGSYSVAGGGVGLDPTLASEHKAAPANKVGELSVELNKKIDKTKVSEECYVIDKSFFTNPTTTSSNASSVINSAITTAKNSGYNSVLIPNGEYWLKETVYLQDGVILKGCGMDATTLKIANGCDIDAIRVQGPTNNSGLMDLTIDGNDQTNESVYKPGNGGKHGNAINVWLHYGRIERVRTQSVYKHSLLLNYNVSNDGSDGLNFSSEDEFKQGNLNKVLWCDFRDSGLEGIMWGWRTMDSWMCYTNIGSNGANLYLEGGTSRFIGNHFDGDGLNGSGPKYNVYCGDGCNTMTFDSNIFENTQNENIFFKKPGYENVTRTISITNNVIRTCSKSANNTYANISINGYSDSTKATNIIITGNQILNPDLNANHGKCGIELTNCNDVEMHSNTFYNVGDNDVLVDDNSTNIVNSSKINEDIAELGQLKPSETPTAGKLLKVRSVNSDGSFVCEWADAPASGVSDVRVNETTVVTDGVANIPKISSSTFGVAKTESTYGITSTSAGLLAVQSASANEITARSSAYRPIVPNKLVDAVNSVLCSTTASEALTTTEQANARKRIGLDKEWVLKGTITTETKAENLTVDMTGCTEFYVTGTATATGYCSFRKNGYITFIESIIGSGTRTFYFHYKDGGVGIEPICAKYASGTGATVLNSSIAPFVLNGTFTKDITWIGVVNNSAISECDIKIYAR